MVTMFFTVSVINNYALNFNIAMPLHMIFRSVSVASCRHLSSSCSPPLLLFKLLLFPTQGSLIANMILGIIILKKRWFFLCFSFCFVKYLPADSVHLAFSTCRYSASKYLSIVLVSTGIFICTIMSAKQVVSPLQTCCPSQFNRCSSPVIIQSIYWFVSACSVQWWIWGARVLCFYALAYWWVLVKKRARNTGEKSLNFCGKKYLVLHWLLCCFIMI